jgi:4-amino-4-deoxy-L-arabinose transferase-like glycosyltransferase
MPEMNGKNQLKNYTSRGERVLGSALPFAPAPLLTFIIITYLVIGTLYATLTPAWQVPDEPAHYNVIRQIAQTGNLPTLQKGDYDQVYLGQIVGQKFPPELSVEGVQYQDYQPPLYYVLAVPVYLLSGGSLIAVRLFSLALGTGVLVFAFLITRSLISRWAGVIAAAFIAFIPQHTSIMAGVNNDALSELLIAAGLFLVVRGQGLGVKSQPPAWLFGLVLGLAFITKVQAYILAPVFLAHALLLWRKRPEHPELVEGRGLVRWLMIVFGIGLALGAVYWGRNFFVCGPWDVVCGAWHNQVVVGQPTTAEWLAQYGWWGSADALLNRFFTFTFQSFWGQFGWMSVVMDRRVYAALLAFTVVLVIGTIAASRQLLVISYWRRASVLLLAFSALLTLGLYIYYNFGFVQHQGRYLFPALVPLSVAVAASLHQWAKWLSAVPVIGRYAPLFPVMPLAGLAALCVFALFRFILPALG